jgi:hypothetical protein
MRRPLKENQCCSKGWATTDLAQFRAAGRLEALAVDDRGARFVVLLLADPHLLEGGQGRQDRASDPDRVLALGRGDDLDLHRAANKTLIGGLATLESVCV